MAAIERIDHQDELICEAIEADGRRCPECYETGPKGKLFVFGSRRGGRIRVHAGAFCSQDCHDVYYGLKLRSG